MVEELLCFHLLMNWKKQHSQGAFLNVYLSLWSILFSVIKIILKSSWRELGKNVFFMIKHLYYEGRRWETNKQKPNITFALGKWEVKLDSTKKGGYKMSTRNLLGKWVPQGSVVEGALYIVHILFIYWCFTIVVSQVNHMSFGP